MQSDQFTHRQSYDNMVETSKKSSAKNKQIEEIWTDLHQELKIFIVNKVQDQDIANDILQDVFLKIQLNIHTLSDCSKLTSWVYQITRNSVTDHFRKSKIQLPIDDFDFPEEENEESLYQPLSRCINSKLSQLPEMYKQAILLTSFENLSQTALAEILSISYSGAKTRVQRGREKLKGLILDCSNVKADSNGHITGVLE